MSQNFELMDFESFDLEADSTTDVKEGDGQQSTMPVTVIDTDSAVVDYLVGMFDEPVDSSSSLDEFETQISDEPQVLILGPSCAEVEQLDTLQEWATKYPHVGAVLVTAELTTQILHKALRVGIKDVLAAPIEAEQINETVGRVYESLKFESPELRRGSDDPSEAAKGEEARVISVFSTKGGSGKSVTATNLGVLLAGRVDGPVVLIDGHMQFGDVAVMLQLQPERTAADALAQVDQLDSGFLDDLLLEHESGLKVLPAPLEPTFADQVTGEQVAALIDAVKQYAKYVIIDLPAIFDDIVISALERSDEIVLVAGLDIPNIKNLKICLKTLHLLGISNDNLHLVLNRSNSKVKLDVSEVERSIDLPSAVHVPSDVLVPISVNRGSPVVISAPKSEVAMAFRTLANKFEVVAKNESEQKSRRRFFG